MTPGIELPGGVTIPQVGLGVFKVPPEETYENVARGLELGYRHVDTARAYRNEAEVGRAVRDSGLPREEIFVTTKLWPDAFDDAFGQLQRSLDLLGLDFVDLFLIHWPAPARDRYAEAWRGLIEGQRAGLARAIGVSNFHPPHLRRIIDETGVVPAVNQIELHPYLVQAELRREHARLGIVTEAWSPLARAGVLGDPVVAGIARAHDRTPAQVVLRWHLQLGHVVFPKSVTPARLAENLDVFGFELSAGELARIEALDRGERTGPDPDAFGG